MSEPLDARRESALRWLDYARRDLKNARASLADEDLLGLAAFHAQQTAEKALKAYAVWLGVSKIPKTHKLIRLAGIVREAGGDSFSEEELAELTDYAVDGRYPDTPVPGKVAAVQAVEFAASVYELVRERVGQVKE